MASDKLMTRMHGLYLEGPSLDMSHVTRRIITALTTLDDSRTIKIFDIFSKPSRDRDHDNLTLAPPFC